ncbi:MAG: hypothetical protein ACLS83_03235 [Oscillospiraceae bacterium]|jgi:hypothetical protein
MKHARIIVVLVLLALSFSGCANADYFDGTPSSEETAMTEPVLSTAPQERTTVSVSESTEIFAESTAEPETVEIPPEVSIPVADHAKLPTESSAMEPAPPKASEPEPPTEPMATQPQEPESPAEEEPTEPAFDIQTWIDYAKAYAESIGLRMESSAVDCWDNPISVGTHCSYLERDIQSRLNRYARDEDITDVWIWAEARSDGKYDLYIGYA